MTPQERREQIIQSIRARNAGKTQEQLMAEHCEALRRLAAIPITKRPNVCPHCGTAHQGVDKQRE